MWDGREDFSEEVVFGLRFKSEWELDGKGEVGWVIVGFFFVMCVFGRVMFDLG